MRKLIFAATVVLLGSLLGLIPPGPNRASAVTASFTPLDDGLRLAAGDSAPAETFVGQIVKLDGGFALQAGAGTYQLDNQAEAAKFEGKNVKVTGTLDPATNTIQVQKIELA
jgi:streptogramin lyase